MTNRVNLLLDTGPTVNLLDKRTYQKIGANWQKENLLLSYLTEAVIQ